jgi:hypothetical protein
MFNRIFWMIALSVSALSVQSQDARLSQLWSAPLHVNPALSGRFDGQGRFSSLASWQSSSIPSAKDVTKDSINVNIPHQNFSIDFKFGKYRYSGDEQAYAIGKKAPESDKKQEAKDETGDKSANKGYWSAGINFYRYGGKITPLHGTFVSATVARHFFKGNNIYYGVGAQVAYANGQLDENRGVKFDAEIGGGGFRYPHQYVRPNNTVNKNNYFDFNLGGYFGMTSEMVSFEIGLAMYHWFYPKSYIVPNPDGGPDNETKLRHRLTGHSLLRLKVLNKFGMIQRNIIWEEGLYLRSSVFNGDRVQKTAFYSGVELIKLDPKSIYNLNFGLYSRSFKTLMPYLNANLGRIATVRLSHELPINSDRFNAYSAKRTEIALLLSYKRYTSPGVRFYKKSNFW